MSDGRRYVPQWRWHDRFWFAFLIASVAAACLALWVLSNLLLLVFGAVLVAIVLNSLTQPVVRWTGFGPKPAPAFVVAALAVPASGFFAHGRANRR